MRRIKSVVPLKLPVKNRPLKADNGGIRPCLKIRQESSKVTTVSAVLPCTERQLS